MEEDENEECFNGLFYPNHCGLVKDMVYLKYIFVKMYKNKNKL